MSGVIIVGVGNRHRRDDGVGPEIATRAASTARKAEARVEVTDDPSTLVDHLAGADLAVIVDASAPAGSPGAIHVLDGTDPDALATVPQVSTHMMGVSQALGLAAALGHLPKTVRVVAIEAEDVSHGEGFSEAVTGAIARATTIVLEEAGCITSQ